MKLLIVFLFFCLTVFQFFYERAQFLTDFGSVFLHLVSLSLYLVTYYRLTNLSVVWHILFVLTWLIFWFTNFYVQIFNKSKLQIVQYIYEAYLAICIILIATFISFHSI